MTSLMRVRREGEHAKVGFVELFFDLVFVFAITQVSHLLLAHLTPLGTLEAAILLAAVWWVWIDTSWITNWLDVERGPVRLMLFALMAAGLIMSTSLPEAFGDKGLVFACAFAAMQVGRSLFTLRCAARRFRRPTSSGFRPGPCWGRCSGSAAGWRRDRRDC